MLIKNEANDKIEKREEIDENNDIDYCNDNLNEVLITFVLFCDNSLTVEMTEKKMSDVSNVSFRFLIIVIEKIDFFASSSSNDAFKEFV